jgi:3-oxoadipate enol-lactonase
MPSVPVPLPSPQAGTEPITVDVVEEGRGSALVFLHGGWGYDIYPIDRPALARHHQVVIPSRSGYGRSTPVDAFPAHFHHQAVLETVAVLDALNIERAVWWGHSDGAVIAAMAALEVPQRVEALVVEALHYYADKPRSRAFFERMATDPDAFGERVRRTLAAEHGELRWRTVLHLDGQAWLDLADQAAAPHSDLYRGRLGEVTQPTLIIHGGQDPRTEAGELDAIRAALPAAQLALYPEAGHSPHSEKPTREAVTTLIAAFLGDPPRTP